MKNEATLCLVISITKSEATYNLKESSLRTVIILSVAFKEKTSSLQIIVIKSVAFYLIMSSLYNQVYRV